MVGISLIERGAGDERTWKCHGERGYRANAELSVSGIGTITLRSNRPVQSDDRLDQAKQRRQTLLASIGVRDLSEARQRQSRSHQLEAEVTELRGRLSLFAPEGLAKLREDVAARKASSADVLELKEDPAQVRSALLEAEIWRTQTRQILRDVDPRRMIADEAFIVIQTEFATLSAERSGRGDSRGTCGALRSRTRPSGCACGP